MGKIQLNYDEMEKALNKLKSSTNLISASPNAITGNNKLDVVDKLIEINDALHNLSTIYKEQLLANIDATNQSISALKEADELISSSIKQK